MMNKEKMFDAQRPLQIADQGCFHVGGRYVDTAGGRIMAGQMFVQYQIPAHKTQPYPLVMMHGGGQTGVNFLGTPDGRRGWADYFLAQGYAVYVVDQPGRGRSGYFNAVYGKSAIRGASPVADRFTAPERAKLWPQAHLHTQWPAAGDDGHGGTEGDAVFDQFYASQVESANDIGAGEQMMREAGSALLDKIGPAILLTHSQAGPFGWTIADALPALVKGILAIEPNGAPVYEVSFTGAPDYFEDDTMTRPWGITRNALTFAPAAASAEDMRFTRQDKPDGDGLMCCWLQAGPARQLVNLKGIPILIVTAEASYHAPYDHCTSQFLKQAGVEHDFVRLADVGIRGNGHMMMLEKNNLEIARYLDGWVRGRVK